jgi:uncharacterized DUF497 family protein
MASNPRKRNGWLSGRVHYPDYCGDDRWVVWGQGEGGRYLQVVFLIDEDGTLYIIHARPLTDREKRLLRRRTRA